MYIFLNYMIEKIFRLIDSEYLLNQSEAIGF